MPTIVGRLIHEEAGRRGLNPNELAVRIAQQWQREGKIADYRLPVNA